MPPRRESAVKIAWQPLKQGHPLDLGLIQINSVHPKKGTELADLFDPCFNIRTGTKILARFYRGHAKNSRQDPADMTLLKALSSLNSGTPYKGKYYVKRILKRAGFKVNDTAGPGTANLARPQGAVAFFRKGGGND